jgi:hypothetical protein
MPDICVYNLQAMLQGGRHIHNNSQILYDCTKQLELILRQLTTYLHLQNMTTIHMHTLYMIALNS